MTMPPTAGPSRPKQIIAFLGIVADMAGVAALLSQGFQPLDITNTLTKGAAHE